MDTHTSSRRALKLAQEQAVQSLKIRDGPVVRDTELDVLQRLPEQRREKAKGERSC